MLLGIYITQERPTQVVGALTTNNAHFVTVFASSPLSSMYEVASLYQVAYLPRTSPRSLPLGCPLRCC